MYAPVGVVSRTYSRLITVPAFACHVRVRIAFLNFRTGLVILV